jgi:hypothetical protein
MKCQEEDNNCLYDFLEREAKAGSFLSTTSFYHLGAATVNDLVTVDGNGPLAGSKLHLFSPGLKRRKKGGTTNSTSSLS